MTWSNRLRLFLGLVIVIVIVCLLTLVFAQRQLSMDSTTATISARSYPVGSDFGGQVTQQYVTQGQTVKAGQKMFTIQSRALQNELATGQLRGDAAAGIGPDGSVTVVAAVPGTVSQLTARQGAYASGGSILATLDGKDSLHVEAEYLMDSGDYGRLQRGAEVDIRLPDQKVLKGTVSRIDVSTVRGKAKTKVTVSSQQLDQGGDDGLIAPGTPVTATVRLRDDGILAGPLDALSGMFREMGL